MSNSSNVEIHQSTTTVAKTPSPGPSSTIKNPITTPSNENESQQLQRLQLYNSLFGQQRKNPCEKTGLHHESSLNYLLHTFLHLSDIAWVLAMITIDTDEMNKMNRILGRQNVINKINQVGTVIKSFSDNDPRKLKGFTLNYKEKNINYINDIMDDDNDVVIFALLMYCHPDLKISEKYVTKLIKCLKYDNISNRIR